MKLPRLPRLAKRESAHPHIHRAEMSNVGRSAFAPTATVAFSPSGEPMPIQAFDTSAEGA
jgi:hypothetical protein